MRLTALCNQTSQISAHFPFPSVSGVKPFHVNNFTSYSLDKDFFIISDAWSLEIADDRINQIYSFIRAGDPIYLTLDERILCTGYVERINLSSSRNGGQILKIAGRDNFGPICDASCRPDLKFKETDTYWGVIIKILEEFGFAEENVIATEDVENEAKYFTLGGGGKQGMGKEKTRSKARKKKSFLKHQLKPNKGEGYMQFLIRICERCGWHIKCCPDGFHVYLGLPTYDRDEDPDYQLIHSIDNPNKNNVISSNLDFNYQKQPSYILAECNSSGKEHRKNVINSFINNVLVTTTIQGNLANFYDKNTKDFAKKGYKEIITGNASLMDFASTLLAANPGLQITDSQKKNKQLYLYEFDCGSQDELEFYIQRKMADFQNQFLTLKYVVNNHVMSNQLFQINTMCSIKDDLLLPNVDKKFWIQKVTYTKSRMSGTKTEITLRIPYIYNLE